MDSRFSCSSATTNLPFKIWSDNAKELTLQAAETAGFGDRTTLQLVSEPDAAAAWTLLRDLKSNFLQVKIPPLKPYLANCHLSCLTSIDRSMTHSSLWTVVVAPLYVLPTLYAYIYCSLINYSRTLFHIRSQKRVQISQSKSVPQVLEVYVAQPFSMETSRIWSGPA